MRFLQVCVKSKMTFSSFKTNNPMNIQYIMKKMTPICKRNRIVTKYIFIIGNEEQVSLDFITCDYLLKVIGTAQ